MRKVLLALAVAAAVALGVTGGGGSASADSQGAEQLVAGTGTLICCGQPMLHVNAQSGAGGVNPRGHFWIRYPNGVEFGGQIVCLTVTLNQAGLTGHIEKVKTANPVLGFVSGNYLNIEVTDNGPPPGTGAPAPDLVNFHPGHETQPDSCPVDSPDLPLSQGNYVVHDKPVANLAGMLGLDQFIAQIESAANDPYG